MASVARNDTGKYSVTFTTAMTSDAYAVLLTAGSNKDHIITEESKSTTGFSFQTTDAGGNNVYQNTSEVYFAVFM